MKAVHQDFLEHFKRKGGKSEVDTLKHLGRILRHGDYSNEIFKSFKVENEVLKNTTTLKKFFKPGK